MFFFLITEAEVIEIPPLENAQAGQTTPDRFTEIESKCPNSFPFIRLDYISRSIKSELPKYKELIRFPTQVENTIVMFDTAIWLI